MERTNAAFLVVVALSVLLGTTVAAGLGSNLRTLDAISVVEEQITTEVTGVSLAKQSLMITVRIDNPTRYDYQLTGSHFRASNDTEPKLAYGSGKRLDDDTNILAATDSVTVRYRIRLTPTQTRMLQRSLEVGDAVLTGTHSLTLDGVQFSVTIGPEPLTASEGSS